MTFAANSRPIAEGLFTWPAAEPRLLGSRCLGCKRVEFPVQTGCMACGSEHVAVEEMPRVGTLWTWTVQRFLPKSPYNSGESPATFTPYGVGYVELPGAVRVEARLTENDPHKLNIGMPMELVFDVWTRADDGADLINFAFRPVGESA